jgi:hypothetical protein
LDTGRSGPSPKNLSGLQVAVRTRNHPHKPAMVSNLFGRFKKPKPLDDQAKSGLAEAYALQLAVQKEVAGQASRIHDATGQLKPRPLGYIYGYIDAALRTKGLEMADTSVGVPITYQVLRRLWPQHAYECMQLLVDNIATDQVIVAAMMHGGQQCLDYRKPGAVGVPMGLAEFLIEDDTATK